jgi:hypothetical protein
MTRSQEKFLTPTVRALRLTSGEGQYLPARVEFIAWLSSRSADRHRLVRSVTDFDASLAALVQLQPTEVQPQSVACIEPRSDGNYTQMAASAYMWDTASDGSSRSLVQKRVDVLKKIPSPPAVHAVLQVRTEEYPNNILGSLLVGEESRHLLGLFYYSVWEQRLFYYTHLADYAPLFCTFLNLGCQAVYLATGNEGGDLYLDNRVAYFDRFLFPEQ